MKKTNMDKIRERYNKLKNKNNRSKLVWRPTEQPQKIRIVPYMKNPENPFIELYFHYNLGKTVISPVSFGKPDPFVEFAEKLKSTGVREDWEMARELEPKLRTFVPIIVRGKESEGVKYWGFGKTVYTDLMDILVDEEFGYDIIDLVTGKDLKVSAKKESGQDFPITRFMVDNNPSKVSEDKDILNLIKDQPDITDVYELKSFEEMDSLLQRFLDPENEESDDSAEDSFPTDKVNNDTNENKETATVSSDEDIDSLFSDVFDKN